MPSRAYTSFLHNGMERRVVMKQQVSMPSRAYTSFLLVSNVVLPKHHDQCVNALSGLYLISTLTKRVTNVYTYCVCQCPLGLIPHFYINELICRQSEKSVSMPSRAYTSFLLELSCLGWKRKPGCQCPLGLIPHFYGDVVDIAFPAVNPCQCPLGLIPHFYGTPSKT